MQEGVSQEQLEREQGNQEREAMASQGQACMSMGVNSRDSLGVGLTGCHDIWHFRSHTLYKYEIFVGCVHTLIFSFSHFRCEMQRLNADWWR